MRKSGNGAPSVCVNNLLQIARGEVPYERVKGLDPGTFDRPYLEADAEVQQDAQWLIETYEPRATVGEISTALADGPGGEMVLVADIIEEGG